MTSLGCNAKSCTHNKENCCCLSSIKVDGSHADKTQDTCCSNFYEDKTGSRNSAENPNLNLSVTCKAQSCTYNKDCVCNADHIDISGICACDPDGTVCATYKKE